MDLESWKSQLRKGAAEFVVLALLEDEERYGLELLEAAGDESGFEISEGTIYPLLKRLERDGKIEARWREEAGASHPRKYYRLTDPGSEVLREMRRIWTEHARALSRLTREEEVR